jgi:hypothetical protein
MFLPCRDDCNLLTDIEIVELKIADVVRWPKRGGHAFAYGELSEALHHLRVIMSQKSRLRGRSKIVRRFCFIVHEIVAVDFPGNSRHARAASIPLPRSPAVTALSQWK